jgi:hypothetical protein
LSIESGIVPEGNGPYITLTPGLSDGTFQCFLFNPTNVPIDGYAQATYAAPLSDSVYPGQEFRTLVRSEEGWYQIVVTPGRATWIPPTEAYLRGNCDATVFWVPTPTYAPTLTPITNNVDVVEHASGNTLVIINAPSAIFYSRPGFQYETTDVTARGNQYPVVGYAIQDNERWIQVQTPDGQLRWVWGAVVSEFDNSEAPPQ